MGLVLLLACANIATLMLARGARRQREMSVRLALGAGSGRILRQMLVESLLLATIGGLSGLAIAYAARGAVAQYTPHLDWQVFGFTDAITILTGLLFGLAPSSIVEAFWRRRERRDGLPAFVEGTSWRPRERCTLMEALL